MADSTPSGQPARPAHRTATTVLLTLAASLLASAVAAAAFVWSGWYDISANVQHTQAVYSLLEQTMHRSVKLRAAQIRPPAALAGLSARGAVCYRDKCMQCHGGPGVAQADIGRSMQPLPGPLVDASARWTAPELYWITRNGIKMSGMPAWQYRLPEEDLWALVAFMQNLPLLSAVEFESLATAQQGQSCSQPGAAPIRPLGLPDAARGRTALTQYACNACHRVPGVTGTDVHVGPPLGGIAQRGLIAGAVPNTPENMVRWIRHPRSIDPHTTMPDMGVSEADAHDMAAYLATLQ